MAEDDLNRLRANLSPEEASSVLLRSASPQATGVSYLSGEEKSGAKIEKRIVGFVKLDETSDMGDAVLEWVASDEDEFDNKTRWLLIDHGKVAKIVLDVVQPRYVNDPSGKKEPVKFDASYTVAFNY